MDSLFVIAIMLVQLFFVISWWLLQIRGAVESLDLAPMSQQYEQACQELGCSK
jgi:hypothetical protein